MSLHGGGAPNPIGASVEYSEIQNVANQRLLGRNTAGTGVVEEVTWAQLMEWLASSTQGDILYRNATAWTRLAAGTATHFLQTGGAGQNPAWAFANTISDISCRIRKAADQTISNNTATAIVFDTEDYDTATLHDTVTNNTRVTFATAGKYQFFAAVSWATDADGYRILNVRLNGTTNIAVDSIAAVDTNIRTNRVAGEYNFAQNDYIEAVVTHTAGADLACTAFSPQTPIMIVRRVA